MLVAGESTTYQPLRDELDRMTGEVWYVGERPDLAAAYFLRGWAEWLDAPAGPAARADVAKASQLAPNDTFYRDAVSFLAR